MSHYNLVHEAWKHFMQDYELVSFDYNLTNITQENLIENTVEVDVKLSVCCHHINEVIPSGLRSFTYTASDLLCLLDYPVILN